jgi:hypothetical protein
MKFVTFTLQIDFWHEVCYIYITEGRWKIMDGAVILIVVGVVGGGLFLDWLMDRIGLTAEMPDDVRYNGPTKKSW